MAIFRNIIFYIIVANRRFNLEIRMIRHGIWWSSNRGYFALKEFFKFGYFFSRILNALDSTSSPLFVAFVVLNDFPSKIRSHKVPSSFLQREALWAMDAVLRPNRNLFHIFDADWFLVNISTFSHTSTVSIWLEKSLYYFKFGLTTVLAKDLTKFNTINSKHSSLST